MYTENEQQGAEFEKNVSPTFTICNIFFLKLKVSMLDISMCIIFRIKSVLPRTVF